MTTQLTQRTTRLMASLALLFGASNALAIGGGGGAFWMDELKKCSGKPLSGFRIRAGNNVDGVQFRYGDNNWADAHGYQGGNATADVALNPGETIVEVRHRSSGVVNQLTFVTNKNKVWGPYGGSGGNPGTYTVPAGASLSCLSGRASGSIDSIEFAYLEAPKPPEPRQGGMSIGNCATTTTVSGNGSASGSNIQGGGSVGGGVTCQETTGYSDPNGYINVQLSCQDGVFANAQGQAGTNGVSLCADATVGASCTATLAGGGTSQYGGGGGTAGVSGGNAVGGGMCGGVTFTNGSINVDMCGSLAFEVGVDVCINGSVNYKNIYRRVEPFGSRAVAQAAKCAADSTACTFTMGDLLANAAAPYIGRTIGFFDNSGVFRTPAAKDVWTATSASQYRTSNYAKTANKFAGNKLANTTYNEVGKVVNSSNQAVDIGNASVEAGKNAVNKGTKAAKDAGNDAGKAIKSIF